MVRIYPNGEMAALGSERWSAEWQELTKAAKKRYADPDYEHDHDVDEATYVTHHKTKDAALAAARAIMAETPARTVYGAVQVQRQRVEWFVEEDRVAEWADVGDAIEVTAND